MGQSQCQKTNSASIPARSEPHPDDDDDVHCVELEGKKFAEGRFHFAIKCTWLRPREREGQKRVVKHLITELKSSDTCIYDKTNLDIVYYLW